MAANAILEAQRAGQSIWYDNIRRGLLDSGEMARLIGLGITGVTSNPTIFEKAIAGSTDYDGTLLAVDRGSPSKNIFEALAVDDIQATADLLRPIYDRTGGADGYASLEVSPTLAHDTDGTVKEAQRLFATLDRPNVMVKVPATPEGIPAVRQLIAYGININITLIFSLDTYRQVTEAYVSGLEDLAQAGGDVRQVASVASFFVSRVDTAVDALLDGKIREGRMELKALLGKAAIANATLAYDKFKAAFDTERFADLQSKGARVQRPLWASTGTKNPAYSDLHYVEPLVFPHTVNTVPPATLTAFLEHGTADASRQYGVQDSQEALDALADAGVNMDRVTDKLLADGVKAFADSFEKLLANIEAKRSQLLARGYAYPEASLGPLLPVVESAVAELQEQDIVARIWRGDHTVWKPEPAEITNRLRWLTVTDMMGEQVPDLEAFAREVRETGFRHVVLLGMGGSSLGPEVLRQTLGSAKGYPELIVLDSTVPARVEEVTQAIVPVRTLFLVSSKSGGTVEPLSFYKYFRSLVEQSSGNEKAGENFVAITDPGTPLERLAQEQGFRRIFLNPPDIGGRYSVLSYFGLVPAALMGVDIGLMLDRADCMREGCASCVPVHDNSGASLGTVMSALALKGRDKLTLITSPAISSFGLWVEQLIAESTGKEGRGIIPVAGEPVMAPDHYGQDRLFVYLRLEGDDNASVDEAMGRIQASGQPQIRLDLRDRYDLGAEFFRWEFATAVAGAKLGIHPFDQPNVQGAKEMTEKILGHYRSDGQLPGVEPTASLSQLLSQAEPGDYLAIMAYLHQTPELDQALASFRRKVMERYHIATTLGYGPRYLHSTGQLHKGGPPRGLFLQITSGHKKDLLIAGEPYTLGVLADAQALGDLQALQALGRRVTRLDLGQYTGPGFQQLVAALELSS